MRTTPFLALLTAAVAVSFIAPTAHAQLLDKDRVRCESKDGRRETCDTKWPGQTELTKQLSDTRCVKGSTWGSSPGKVWVDNGCRADFGPAFGGREVRCESDDGRRKTCGKNLYGNADLIRQLSATSCKEGVSWGLQGGSIWVDNGCRGVFRVGESSGRYSVTCGSEGGRRQSCAWDAKHGVPSVLETLSKSPCVQGKSWGYTRKTGLWVDEGCRARFGVR
jgi:hypothetical protein